MDSGIPQKSDPASQSMGYPVDQFGRPINPDLSSEVNSSPTNDRVDTRSAENSSRVGSIAASAYNGTMEVSPQENGAIQEKYNLGDRVRLEEQNQPSIPGNEEQGVSLDRNLLEPETSTGNVANEGITVPEKTSGKILDFPGKKIKKESAEDPKAAYTAALEEFIINPEAAYDATRDDVAEYVKKLRGQSKAA